MATCQVSINFNYNPDYETVQVPGFMIERLLEQSKGCFHIYTYLCLLANKNEKIKMKDITESVEEDIYLKNDEFGRVVNINTKKIASALGMKIRTVQQCLKDMYEAKLLLKVHSYKNKDNDQDIYITGYRRMRKIKNFLQLPKEIFENTILKADKGTISLFLYEFSTIFKNTLAKLESVKSKNKNLTYAEIIHGVKIEKDLNESTLLSAMKRTSRKILEESHLKLENIGFVFDETLTYDRKQTKFVIKAYSLITKLFKPKNENLSIIKKYPNIFNQVLGCIDTFGMKDCFQARKEFEDLTQMLNQYGQVPFMAGLLAYQSSGTLNDNVTDKCAYIRRCIDNWLYNNQDNKIK